MVLNISDGLLPFAFIPQLTAMKQRLGAISQVDTYGDMITMPGNLLLLADSKTLSKSAAFIPVTWRQAILQITGYLPVLVALLEGEPLPITLSYQQGLAYIIEHQDTFEEAFSQEPGVGERLDPALVLVYYFIGRMRSWMVEQWRSERPMAPLSFKLRFDNLIHFGQMNWLPNIRNIPKLVALKIGRGNATSGQTSHSSSERPVSGERQVRLLNNEMDTRLLPCTLLGKRISSTRILDAVKNVKAKGEDFCLRDDGEQKCHTWHAKGFCYSFCSHKADHIKRPNAEMNGFHEWCKKAFSE